MPYQLEIHLPDNEVETIELVGPSTLGSSEQAELCIQDYNLPAKLCRFRIAQGVLTVMNLGAQKPPLKIGKQKLERGKMYILDDEDVLSFGKLKMVIHELSLDEDENEDDIQDISRNDSSQPKFDSSAELLADVTEADEAPEPTSLSITQVLQKAKEESGEHEIPKQKKPNTSSDSEKTSSRLIQLTQKVKSALAPKRAGKGPVKAGAPEIVSHKNSNPSGGKLTQGWPGLVPRLLAFTLEMGACALIATPLAKQAEILSQWERLFEKVDQLSVQQPELQILSELMTLLQLHGLLTILLFVILQIFIGFIFGRSLGYVFLGINEDSGFISKRIKAVLRSLIFFLTGPFLIFDLPILIKKRSFKEWLTRSALYRPSLWPGLLSSIFLFPPLILFFLLNSVISQREIIPTEFIQLQPAEVSSRLTFESLELRFPLSALEERESLPRIEKTGKPSLWLYHRGLDQNPIGLELEASYSLEDWTQGLLDHNIALSFVNPELYEFLESASTPGPLSLDQRQQLEQLLKDSVLPLDLDLQSSLQLLKTYGPGLSVLNLFSQNLKDSLSLNAQTKLKWISFLQRDVLWIETKRDETFEVQLLFMDASPFRSLKVFVPLAEKETAYEIIEKDLIQVLPVLPGPSPRGEELENLSHQVTDKSLGLFLNSPMDAQELDKLYQAFFQLTGELLGGTSNLYREQFERQMDLLIDQLNNQPDKSTELQKFTEELKKLFTAYQNQKSSFFIEQETDSVDSTQNKGDDI